MTPLFFGTATRRLFGIYEPARKTDRAPRAAVLCHPWGQEYLRAHRSMCRLARTLAASGWDTIRFDYYGTGDSAGDLIETNLRGWEEDIEWAIEEAKATSGADRVALIGLRLGANLAASVAGRQSKEVEALILWDPVVRGSEFLSEVFALETTISRAPPLERASEVGGGHEILGFALTAAMAREIRSLDLRFLQLGFARTHANACFAASDRLRRSSSRRWLGAHDNPLSVERVPICRPGWMIASLVSELSPSTRCKGSRNGCPRRADSRAACIDGQAQVARRHLYRIFAVARRHRLPRSFS